MVYGPIRSGRSEEFSSSGIRSDGLRVSQPRLRVVVAVVLLALVATACKGSRDIAVGSGIRFPVQATKTGAATLTLEGATWGTGSTAVVFAHSRPTTMDAWASFARAMSAQGFLALTFNFRGYGLSEGVKDPSTVDLDLEAAIAKAESLGAKRVVVVGASMGGTAALVVGARKVLAGVVTLSAPATFGGLDALAAAPALKEAVVFFAADGDGSAAADARAMFAAAPEPKRVEILKSSSAHGTDLLEGPTAGRVTNDIAQFLIDHRG